MMPAAGRASTVRVDVPEPSATSRAPEASPSAEDATADVERGGGRMARAVAWSKTAMSTSTAWAVDSRDRHASVDVGLRAADRDRRAAAMVLAGGIAYRLFFWVLALALVASGVLGFLGPEDVQRSGERAGLGTALAGSVGQIARSASDHPWWLLLVGGWLVLWTGYTCAKALALTHASIWGVAPGRLASHVRASLAFTGGTLALIAAMLAASWVRGHAAAAGLAATMLVLAVPFGGWLVVTRALPNRASGWIELVPGAALFAVGEQAMHLFTAYFLGPKLASATQLYGLLGIVTTILFWFYWTGRLIIAAAILDVSFAERRAGGMSVEPPPA
jgi:uncharacterized BrkB/YihY/UPF0761 family membrane protein